MDNNKIAEIAKEMIDRKLAEVCTCQKDAIDPDCHVCFGEKIILTTKGLESVVGDLAYCPMFVKALRDEWLFKILTVAGDVIVGESIEILSHGWIHIKAERLSQHYSSEIQNDKVFKDLGRGIQIRAKDIVAITEFDS